LVGCQQIEADAEMGLFEEVQPKCQVSQNGAVELIAVPGLEVGLSKVLTACEARVLQGLLVITEDSS
jgi:hypothetical protein